MKTIFAALALAAVLLGQAQAQTFDRDIEMRTLTHAGVTRSYGVYAPATLDRTRPAPLIVALHGRYSSAKAFHALSGLAELAEARGAIVIYPETAGAYWNDGGFTALARRRETPHDDAGFVAAAIEAVRGQFSVDQTRMFLTGYDSGGGLAYRLACGAAHPYAGVAVVSALMWDYAAQDCTARPASMLIVHGRRDELFPVRGGAPGAPVTAERYGADQTVAFWRGRLGCAERASQTRGSSAFYASCGGGAALAYVGVEGGSHDWFRQGGGYQLNQHGVSTARLIDEFFFARSEFVLPQSRGGRRSRAWLVYAPPSYNPSQPMPVVVMLHGRTGTASGMASMTEMNAVAARHGFIVVYPEGLDNEWNAQFDLIGRDVRLGGQRGVLPQDDVEFLKTLVADVGVDLNIDRRRMYVAGFSNGGFMTMRMACSASDTFAGFAEVGASLYTVMTDLCRRSPPSPILFMHGSADPSIPYEGVEVEDPTGQYGATRVTLSVMNTVSLFVSRNRCSFAGQSTTFAEGGQSPGTHVVRFIPNTCDGAPVAFYLINGGGHQWPGVRVLPEENFGLINMDINAGEVIWDFFSRQTLPAAG